MSLKKKKKPVAKKKTLKKKKKKQFVVLSPSTIKTAKHAGGRPTIYTPELLSRCYNYIAPFTKKKAKSIPSHIGLALHLGINRDTLYNWGQSESKREFSDILDLILMLQQQILINNGLNGYFNAAITKLVLGKHGFHEKTDTAHSGIIGAVNVTDKTEEELKAIIRGEF